VNTPTAIATYVFGFLVVLGIGLVIRRMLRGWESRARRQAEAIGELPALPGRLGPAAVAPARGLYLGSTLAGEWLERVNVGDLGFRCRAVLTRYPEGILLERSGAGPIWIPQQAITSVRAERALAGKVIVGRGGPDAPGRILVIRWRLPSGTDIDTGFRGEDSRDYTPWTGVSA